MYDEELCCSCAFLVFVPSYSSFFFIVAYILHVCFACCKQGQNKTADQKYFEFLHHTFRFGYNTSSAIRRLATVKKGLPEKFTGSSGIGLPSEQCTLCSEKSKQEQTGSRLADITVKSINKEKVYAKSSEMVTTKGGAIVYELIKKRMFYLF